MADWAGHAPSVSAPNTTTPQQTPHSPERATHSELGSKARDVTGPGQDPTTHTRHVPDGPRSEVRSMEGQDATSPEGRRPDLPQTPLSRENKATKRLTSLQVFYLADTVLTQVGCPGCREVGGIRRPENPEVRKYRCESCHHLVDWSIIRLELDAKLKHSFIVPTHSGLRGFYGIGRDDTDMSGRGSACSSRRSSNASVSATRTEALPSLTQTSGKGSASMTEPLTTQEPAFLKDIAALQSLATQWDIPEPPSKDAPTQDWAIYSLKIFHQHLQKAALLSDAAQTALKSSRKYYEVTARAILQYQKQATFTAAGRQARSYAQVATPTSSATPTSVVNGTLTFQPKINVAAGAYFTKHVTPTTAITPVFSAYVRPIPEITAIYVGNVGRFPISSLHQGMSAKGVPRAAHLHIDYVGRAELEILCEKEYVPALLAAAKASGMTHLHSFDPLARNVQKGTSTETVGDRRRRMLSGLVRRLTGPITRSPHMAVREYCRSLRDEAVRDLEILGVGQGEIQQLKKMRKDAPGGMTAQTASSSSAAPGQVAGNQDTDAPPPDAPPRVAPVLVPDAAKSPTMDAGASTSASGTSASGSRHGGRAEGDGSSQRAAPAQKHTGAKVPTNAAAEQDEVLRDVTSTAEKRKAARLYTDTSDELSDDMQGVGSDGEADPAADLMAPPSGDRARLAKMHRTAQEATKKAGVRKSKSRRR